MSSSSRDMMPVGTLPFNVLCSFLDTLSTSHKVTRTRLKKTKRADEMKDFLSRFGLNQQNLFPILRLILPQLDTEFGTYGMKEKGYMKNYIFAMGLDKKNPDAQYLMNFANPPAHNDKTRPQIIAGFVPSVLEAKLVDRGGRPEKGTLSIDDVIGHLRALHKAPNEDTRRKTLRIIYQQCTTTEQYWFACIVLKSMKIGLKENSVFNILHRDAKKVFNMCSSLETVCECVLNEDRIKEMVSNLRLFEAVQPMLCERASTTNCVDKLPNGGANGFVVQPKHDGERIMIHFEKNKNTDKDVKLMLRTRNGFDVTNRYGYGKSVLPSMKEAFAKVDNVMLDGELMAWDAKVGKFLPFGNNRVITNTRRGRNQMKKADVDGPWGQGDGGEKEVEEEENDLDHHGNSSESKLPSSVNLMYVIFDMLFLNGETLIDEPWYVRIGKMKEFIIEIPGKVQFIETYTNLTTTLDVMDKLDHMLNEGHEGLVMKDVNSVYQLGGRGFSWLKLKPDYVDGMGETLDMVVLGAYYGKKASRSKLQDRICSGFLLGVWDDVQSDENNPKFWTFGKVAGGFSMNILEDLHLRFRESYQKAQNRQTPPWLHPWQMREDDCPHLWVPYDKSVVLEVKTYEIMSNRCFSAGLTHRFPRCIAVRDDKTWREAMSMTELKKLNEAARGNNNTGITAGALYRQNGGKPKKRKISPTKKQPPSKAKLIRGLGDRTKITVENFLFLDMKFYVLSDKNFRFIDTIQSINEVDAKKIAEILITKNGGQLDDGKLHGEDTILLATRDSPMTTKINPYKKHDKWDILTLDWLQDCLITNTIVEVHTDVPKYSLYLSSKTKASLHERIDPYGLPYYNTGEPLTLEMLDKAIHAFEMQQVPTWSVENARVTAEDVDAVDSICSEAGNAWFNRCVIYLESFTPPLPNTNDIFGWKEMDTAMDMKQAHKYSVATRHHHVSLVQLFHGHITDTVNTHTTHIMFDMHTLKTTYGPRMATELYEQRYKALMSTLKGRKARPYVVTTDWLNECIEEKRRVDENLFKPMFTMPGDKRKLPLK